MFWPMLAIALGFLGTVVLGTLGIRVFLEAQRLGRQVAATTERINRAAEESASGKTIKPVLRMPH